MKIKSIFINLPVRDLNQTRTFWTRLGFSFNEQFSDNKAICMVLNDSIISSMFTTHEFFSTFTNRPIADHSKTQVLIAIEVESRNKVDELVQLALENGGSRYKESQDHGWLYYNSFADPDGHQWEVLYSNPLQTPQ